MGFQEKIEEYHNDGKFPHKWEKEEDLWSICKDCGTSRCGMPNGVTLCTGMTFDKWSLKSSWFK